MAKSTLTYSPKGFTTAVQSFISADGTVSKLVATPSADDSIIKAIVMTSNDVSGSPGAGIKIVELIINDGSVDRVIGAILVPPGAGTDGYTPAVDALNASWLPLDRAGKRVLPLQGGYTLRARPISPVNASFKLTIMATLENF